MKKYLIIVFMCFILIVSGCSDNEKIVDDSKTNSTIITGAEAKEKITDGAVLLDVRTKEEFAENHINGAILLPLSEINASSVEKIIPDKTVEIIVYCRSGNRSGQAVDVLHDLGYENVYDLGSINNWEE